MRLPGCPLTPSLGRTVRRMAQDLNFCTIVTYGRTGSTALQAAANAHPGVLIRGENYSALRGMRIYMQSVAETASRHHSGKADHPWFGSARMDPHHIRTRMRREVIEGLLRPRPKTQWLGFKEIRYSSAHWPDYDHLLEYLLFLQTLLPNLRFLFNVRSADDAMKSAWWRQEPDALSILHTTHEWLNQAHVDLSSILGAHRSCIIDYGDWSKNPVLVTQAFAHIGLPVHDELVRASLSQHLHHGPAT
jgi:hypothetical protein